MGRRELLIIVAFVALGALAYQFTAPPAAEGRGFSLRRLVDEIRADIRRDSAVATTTHSETIALDRSITELRVSGVTSGIEVTGEDRPDLTYELSVRSTGPDESSALAYATRSVLEQDHLDDTLWLRVSRPPEGRQTTELVLRVPRRLGVRVEGGNRSSLKDLRSVRLEGVVGEVTADTIAADVTGLHRNGRLRLENVGAVALTLQASRAALSGVRSGIRLSASRGETTIAGSSGMVEVEQSGNELHVIDHLGPIRVGGSRGRIEIVHPRREVHVDVQGTEIDVTLADAVPMTIITTTEPLRLLLEGPPPIVLDALITGRGTIDASSVPLAGIERGDGASLAHAFGPSASVRVLLRNRRGNIVIRLAK